MWPLHIVGSSFAQKVHHILVLHLPTMIAQKPLVLIPKIDPLCIKIAQIPMPKISHNFPSLSTPKILMALHWVVSSCFLVGWWGVGGSGGEIDGVVVFFQRNSHFLSHKLIIATDITHLIIHSHIIRLKLPATLWKILTRFIFFGYLKLLPTLTPHIPIIHLPFTLYFYNPLYFAYRFLMYLLMDLLGWVICSKGGGGGDWVSENLGVVQLGGD